MSKPKKRQKRPVKKQTIESLMARTVAEGDCLEWQGYVYKGNNPQVSHDGKIFAVRKLMMLLSNRKTPTRAYHKTYCGNDLCVRPEHIKVVDCKKHMAEMGRMVSHNAPTRIAKLQEAAKGRRKLSDDQVQEILLSDQSSRVLSEIYGVSKTTITRVKSNKTRRVISASVNPFVGLMR